MSGWADRGDARPPEPRARLTDPPAPVVPELVEHRELAGRSPAAIAKDNWLRCGPKSHAWKVL